MCGFGFGQADASVVCRQLGYYPVGKSVGARVHRMMPMPVMNLIIVGLHNHCILMLKDAGGDILLSSHCICLYAQNGHSLARG